MARVKDMTKGSPLKLILGFALPLMFGNIFQQLYSMVDTIVVGRVVGVEALASVGAASWLDWLVLGIVMGMTQGFGILMAQRFGAEDREGLRRSITMSVYLSVIMAVGIFMVLPYYLSSLLKNLIPSYNIRTVIEGFIRIGIFVVYILLISRMEDIQRLFQYHGAEHKCINCIEHGLCLNVENVRISSRQHKRCGTSFIFFVLIISICLLMIVRAESPLMRAAVRIALLPVIAGISYEILKLAGRSENPIVNLLSKPGLAIQKLTTKEPDDSMIEVAIQAVEAVFDWQEFERENFSRDGNEAWEEG